MITEYVQRVLEGVCHQLSLLLSSDGASAAAAEGACVVVARGGLARSGGEWEWSVSSGGRG